MDKTLTEKIAKLIEAETKGGDMAALFARLDKIDRRLDRLESTPRPVPEVRPGHPSLDKFSVAESIADEIFAGVQKEKACTFEPNGKPCDHCSMCNSRGF